MDTVEILGVRVHTVTNREAMERIAVLVAAGPSHQVVTVNPEFVMAARRDTAFRQVLNRADLSLPDGIGLVWAARLLYGRGALSERVAGIDTVERLAEMGARQGWRLYFLGAAEGVAERAAKTLSVRYPGLTIAGTHAGSPVEPEAAAIVARVRAARPDVLFVAYGAPAQDLWIARHAEELQVPVTLGIGGSLDVIAGVTRRAPLWMQRRGLEWLYRLLRQPWRWRRMAALPRFAALVIWQRLAGPRRKSGVETYHA
ncbi:MAG: WecB/TagA/CpsF family glycosyltransferase [Anaerolineae bacterium]|nr:WecB/TagA/CpsF family glycosyltransferase [Anaerolineae bacterium]